MADCAGRNNGRPNMSYCQDTGYLASAEGAANMAWTPDGNSMVCLARIYQASPKDAGSSADRYCNNNIISNDTQCIRGLCGIGARHHTANRAPGCREHPM